MFFLSRILPRVIAIINNIIISMIIIICSCNVFKVFANTSDQLKKQQQENKEEIEKAENEQKIIKSQMSSIEKELDNLNSQISSCEGEIYNLNLDLQNVNENIKSTEKELEKTERELTEKEELLKKRLIASYKTGETSYLDVLLNSDSLTSFLSNSNVNSLFSKSFFLFTLYKYKGVE